MQVNAQTFQIKSLIGTKWEEVKDYEYTNTTTIEFTSSEMIETDVFIKNNHVYSSKRQYYLSQTIPTSFNKEMVGKTTSGSYLVFMYKKNNTLDYKSIKKITNDTLILFRYNPGSVGGCDQTYTYRRIKQ